MISHEAAYYMMTKPAASSFWCAERNLHFPLMHLSMSNEYINKLAEAWFSFYGSLMSRPFFAKRSTGSKDEQHLQDLFDNTERLIS